MKTKKLSRKFFARPTLTVAKDLLGKILVRKIGPTSPRLRRAGRKIIGAMITETEAYCGPRDLASHASKGRTKRTEVMFGPAGHAYIYLIYGMYYCLNIVTEKENYPAAVLIRAAIISDKNLHGPARQNFSTSTPGAFNKSTSKNLGGPGKLCRHFKIDKSLNDEDLTVSKKLWIEDYGIRLKPSQIKRGKRIGVDYAGPYKHRLWKFFIRSKS